MMMVRRIKTAIRGIDCPRIQQPVRVQVMCEEHNPILFSSSYTCCDFVLSF